MKNDTEMRSNKRRGKAADVAAAAPTAAAAIEGAWCVGIVEADGADALRVISGDLRLRARRAASCLLEPAKGDSVACLRIAPQEVWIMAILQREDSVPNVVRCTGDTTFEVTNGELRLKSPQVSIEGDAVSVSARHATANVESIDALSQTLNLVATKIKVVGHVLSTVMERVQHFSKHHVRTTDGIDRVAATHLECEAKQLLRMEGENALINGRELVKARGSQIHFG